MEWHSGLKAAMAVKAIMETRIYEPLEGVWVESYSNCREQGLYFRGPAGCCSVAENRNSDSIVVYPGRRCDFEMGGNVPKGLAWEQRRYFNYDQHKEAAKFVLDYITKSGHDA